MLDQKKINLNFKKRRLKEMDLLTIMDSIAIEDFRLNHWKARVEQSVIEGKHYIIKYSPKSIFGENLYDTPLIMRFKYREDYEKSKIVNEKIGNILHKLRFERIPKRLKLMRELEELENFVEKCNFLKIDYDDGRLFRTKFHAINRFLAEGEEKFPIFDQWPERPCDEDYLNMFLLLHHDIIPNVKKINKLLVLSGLFSNH